MRPLPQPVAQFPILRHDATPGHPSTNIRRRSRCVRSRLALSISVSREIFPREYWKGLTQPVAIGPGLPTEELVRTASRPTVELFPIINTGGMSRPLCSAALDTDFIVKDVSAPIANVVAAIRKQAPSYVVLRRPWQGKTLDYAFAAEEILNHPKAHPSNGRHMIDSDIMWFAWAVHLEAADIIARQHNEDHARRALQLAGIATGCAANFAWRGHRRTRSEYGRDDRTAISLRERGMQWASDFEAGAREVHALFRIREWGHAD
jgi:hypothetical protein